MATQKSFSDTNYDNDTLADSRQIIPQPETSVQPNTEEPKNMDQVSFRTQQQNEGSSAELLQKNNEEKVQDVAQPQNDAQEQDNENVQDIAAKQQNNAQQLHNRDQMQNRDQRWREWVRGQHTCINQFLCGVVIIPIIAASYILLCPHVLGSTQSECFAQVHGIPNDIVANKTFSTIIQYLSPDMVPCNGPEITPDCSLVSNGTIKHCSVSELKPRRYQVTFMTDVSGTHQLNVVVNGVHIKDSPFEVYAPKLQATYTEECYVEVQDIPDVGVISEKTYILLKYVTLNGELCSRGLREKLECTLLPIGEQADRITSSCDVEPIAKQGNKYEIIFDTEKQGKHQLFITVMGKHINGSPFDIMFIKKFGSPINDLIAPQGITFNQKGDMFVAEYRGHQITHFTWDGSKIKSFGEEGTKPGQLYYPTDVAVNDEGNILVADKKNHRIQMFTPEGRFVTMVGEQGNKTLMFNQPVGISIHPKTKLIYVSENKNSRVQVLNPDLTFHGYLKGQFAFNEPKDVAFDSQGNIYVADNENHQIQVFKESGEYLRRFGKEGREEGYFRYPSSIAIDKDDTLYVLELYNHRVSVFSCMGKFIKTFGSKGHKIGQFNEPRGIAVDEDKNVYVSDRVNDRVQVFKHQPQK